MTKEILQKVTRCVVVQSDCTYEMLCNANNLEDKLQAAKDLDDLTTFLLEMRRWGYDTDGIYSLRQKVGAVSRGLNAEVQ